MRSAYDAYWGFGLGFQMLGGDGTPRLDINERVCLISGGYMDFDGGGFLAAKIMAECVYLGVAVVAGYILILYRVFISCFFDRIVRDAACSSSLLKLRMVGGLFWDSLLSFFKRVWLF